MTVKTTTHALRLIRTVRASAQQAFDAWTRPEQMKQWAAPEGAEVTAAEVDLKVGGKYRIAMRTADGQRHTAVGTYREIKAPTKLVYTWSWEEGMEAEMGETLVTVEFRERDGRTEIALLHDLFPNAEAQQSHEQGWTSCLNRFEALLR